MGVGAAAGAAYFTATANAGADATAFEKFKEGCPTTCALAAMAAVSLISSLKTAKKARGIEGDLSCASSNSCFNNGQGDGNGPGNNPNYNLNPNNPGDRALVELERRSNAADRFLQDREREGYRIDRNRGTITDPKGNPINSVNAAMDSGGMNPQQRAQAERDLAEAAAEGESLLKRMEEYDEEIGGGGGGGNGGSGYNPSSADIRAMRYPTQRGASDPSVAGLSVNHGEDRIGVAGDNIFDMIHRRYQSRAPGMNGP